jgi:DNA polymerase-4
MEKTTRTIFLVDIQSFFAAVEEADNPDLKGKKVVVSGDPEKRHGITLAANPAAKSCGVKTAMPIWQVKNLCPDATFVRPRMGRYVEASIQITEILNQFTDEIEVFSIDEQFLDVTNVISLFGSAEQIARKIEERVYNEVGVNAKVGIGQNKIQAKMACDNFAKKNKDGIFRLDSSNYLRLTADLPVNKLFGVGGRMRRNLERIGIYTIGDLARRPLADLEKRWGINGHVLWMSAQGIDHSPVTNNSTEKHKSVGNSITLPRDYDKKEDIEIILLELSDEVARRVRGMELKARTVNVHVRGGDLEAHNGFNRQLTLASPTDDTLDIYEASRIIFDTYWNRTPIRSIGLNLTQLEDSYELQLDLFSDIERNEKIGNVIDEIRNKHGKTSIFRASSLQPKGLFFDRANKIGGHQK